MCNLEAVKKYRRRNPWARPREWARRRCVDPKHREYKGYGGRGIKFDLTMAEAKALYKRDKGFLLDKPSLDRIDPDGDYTYDNCRFRELMDNVRDHRPPGSIDKEPCKEPKWEE